MTQVRIRHESDTESTSLGQVELDRDALNRLIPTLRGWGVVVDGEEVSEMTGQFVLDETGAYFEVVLHGPDE